MNDAIQADTLTLLTSGGIPSHKQTDYKLYVASFPMPIPMHQCTTAGPVLSLNELSHCLRPSINFKKSTIKQDPKLEKLKIK